MKFRKLLGCCVLGLTWPAACRTSIDASTDGNTSWLEQCANDAECASGAHCLCGVCTLECATDSACAEGAACATDGTAAYSAVCGLSPALSGICLERCAQGSCAGARTCSDGYCVPAPVRDVDAAVSNMADSGLSDVQNTHFEPQNDCGQIPISDATCPVSPPDPGSSCDPAVDGACAYPTVTNESLGLTTYRCDAQYLTWGSSASTVERPCPGPSSQTILLDTSDCADRVAQPCDCYDWRTPQENLDGTIQAFQCLTEAFVWVTFSDGCPTSFTVSLDGNGSITSCLQAALAGLRLECAQGLSCAYAESSTVL